MMRHGHHHAGFTLIEVLVALLIVSVALAAAISTVSKTAEMSLYLKEKTFANWVAENKVVETRLRSDFPSVGRSNGNVKMGDASWTWLLEIKDTPDPNVRRIEVSVKPESQKSDDPVAFVVAFIGRPLT